MLLLPKMPDLVLRSTQDMPSACKVVGECASCRPVDIVRAEQERRLQLAGSGHLSVSLREVCLAVGGLRSLRMLGVSVPFLAGGNWARGSERTSLLKVTGSHLCRARVAGLGGQRIALKRLHRMEM